MRIFSREPRPPRPRFLSTRARHPPGAADPMLLDTALALLHAATSPPPKPPSIALSPPPPPTPGRARRPSPPSWPPGQTSAAPLGDYAGAEADIQTTIEWGENLGPDADPGLAYAYAARAALGDCRQPHRRRGRHPEEHRLGRGPSPQSRAGPGGRATPRGTDPPRRQRSPRRGGRHPKAIAWFESQSPRDERSLSVDYGIRSGIRRDRGTSGGSRHQQEHRLARVTVAAHRAHFAIDYAARADIRFLRGNLSGSETDLQNSIAWYEAQSPRNERVLALR